ncbi:MAG: acyl-CoA dehydrogenase family protein [Rhizobiaceae bacterium]
MADQEVEAMLDAVRRFVATDVAPKAAAYEREERYPDDLIATAREMGLFGLVVPAEYGGLELPLPVFSELMETIARGWTSFASHLTSHSTVAYTISRHGTDEQKNAILPRMVHGDLRAAILLTEAHAGSDLQAIRTTAERAADGGYVLNGAKTYISNGKRSNLLLVLAKTDRTANPPKRGMSLMLVETGMTIGVETGESFDKMAFGSVDTCEVRFSDAALGADAVLGGVEGRGLGQLMDGLELGRLTIASSAVGLAAAALDEAVSFAGERRTFGVLIAEHQAVQLRLADMATSLEAARALTRSAAQALAAGGRTPLVAMAKLAASEAALGITADALRIHGGSGYIRGIAVERFFREAPLYVVGEGTNDILKLAIANTILARGNA